MAATTVVMLAVACDAASTREPSTQSGGGAASPAGTGGSGGEVATGGDGPATSSSSGAAAGSGGVMTAASGGAGGSGGIGGAPSDCNPPCGAGWTCCDSQCVNAANDILNCGTCGNECTQQNPFCDQGTCEDAPCKGAACTINAFCCDTNCCDLSQLCCVVPAGPVGPPQCTDPVDGTCPPGNPGAICAHPDTPVATPSGDRAISSLRAGDLVYSVDQGAIVAVPISRVSHRAVRDHVVVRVHLDTGAVLSISPPHPTADGRSFAELRPGDELMGVTVLFVERVAYDAPFTHDILPRSETGSYFAGGALIGSSLAHSR